MANNELGIVFINLKKNYTINTMLAMASHIFYQDMVAKQWRLLGREKPLLAII